MSKLYELKFRLEGLPTTVNVKLHWAKKHKENKHWKDSVYYVTLPNIPKKPLKHAKVVLTRISSLRPDSDNLCSSFKSVLDSLVYAKILENDKYENIGMPTYQWEKGKQRQGHIRVEVYEVKDVAV